MTQIGKVEVVFCPISACKFNDADTCIGAVEVKFELHTTEIMPDGNRILLCGSFKSRACKTCGEGKGLLCAVDDCIKPDTNEAQFVLCCDCPHAYPCPVCGEKEAV